MESNNHCVHDDMGAEFRDEAAIVLGASFSGLENTGCLSAISPGLA
jgi:hypothetical protein